MGRHLRSVRRGARRTGESLIVARRTTQVWIAGVIVILDQAVKLLVRSRLTLYESVTVVPGLLDLTRVHNTGTAFGFMNLVDFPFKTAVVALMAATALAALAIYGSTLSQEQWLSRLGLSCIIGGAAGNLVDRLSAGYVLDFVDVYRGTWHFWAFNVADAAITLGVTLMILDLLGLGRYRVSRTV
jgi:signal peptidase II